jgi:glycolate oxidase iron-sulfur subunit
MQIGSAADVPVLHTVELIDWATGGPLPDALAGVEFGQSAASAADARQATSEPVGGA